MLSLACSIPNLESPECDQARDQVREFYSYHFGNDLRFEPEDLEKRKSYLTPRFFNSLRGEHKIDPFTLMDDPPKAFRAGKCEVSAPDRTTFEVLLFWHQDRASEEKVLKVETINIDGKWLIDSVTK